MSLFSCRECGCVENTAFCNYWGRKMDGKPLLCSECDPDIKRWHGNFPKHPAAGMLVDQDGNLWTSEQGLPSHYRILGSVAEAAALARKEGA